METNDVHIVYLNPTWFNSFGFRKIALCASGRAIPQAPLELSSHNISQYVPLEVAEGVSGPGLVLDAALRLPDIASAAHA